MDYAYCAAVALGAIALAICISIWRWADRWMAGSCGTDAFFIALCWRVLMLAVVLALIFGGGQA